MQGAVGDGSTPGAQGGRSGSIMPPFPPLPPGLAPAPPLPPGIVPPGMFMPGGIAPPLPLPPGMPLGRHEGIPPGPICGAWPGAQGGGMVMPGGGPEAPAEPTPTAMAPARPAAPIASVFA